MKKLTMLTLLMFAGAAIMGTATANESKLAELDKDNDGRISVEEAASDAALSSVFTELDTDKDGYLTPSELADH